MVSLPKHIHLVSEHLWVEQTTSVLLRPTYGQFLKRVKPMEKQIQVWDEDSMETTERML